MGARDLLVRFGGKVDPSLAGSARKASDEVDKVGKSTERSSKRSGAGLALLAGAAGGVGAIVVGTAGKLLDLGSGAVQASDNVKKFQGTLAFAGKSAADIDRLTKSTQSYADQTVYDLGDIQAVTAQLAANNVKDFDKLAEAAGNLNAVAGGNAETFKSVAMAMTQTAGATKLTTENWNQIADAVPGASGKLQEAMKKNGAFTGNFREAMEKGQITADEFNKAMLDLGMTDVAKQAATSTKTIEGAMGNLGATVQGGLAKAITTLSPAITGLINMASKAMGPLFDMMNKGLGYLVGLGGRIAGSFGGVTAVFDRVKGAFSQFVAGLTLPKDFDRDGIDGFVKFGDTVRGIFTNLVTTVGPALQGIVGTVQRMGAAVLPIVTQVADFVVGKFREWGPSIGAAVGQVAKIVAGGMEVVRVVLDGAVRALSWVWEKAGAHWLEAVGGVLAGLGKAVAGGLDVIQGILSGALALIRGDWDGAGRAWQQIMNGAWKALGGIFQAGKSAVVGSVTLMRDLLSTAMGQGRDWGVGKAKGMRDDVVAAARGMKDSVVEEFTRLKTSMTARMDEARTSVVDRARKLRDGVVGLFEGIGRTIGAKFAGIKDGITSPLRTAADFLNGKVLGPMNDITSKFGVSIPQLPKFHSGAGRVGGALPSGREMLAVLLSDEGVLTKQGVDTLGGPKAVEDANRGRLPAIGGKGPVGGKAWDWTKDKASVMQRLAEHGAKKVLGELFDLAGGIGASFPPPMAGGLLQGAVDRMRSAAMSWGGKKDEESAAVPGNLPPAALGNGRAWPTTTRQLSGNYPGHTGLDFPVPTGTPLYAVAPGVIDYVGWGRGYGNAIFGRFNGMPAVYGHGSRPLVKAGDIVQAGQLIGLSGYTGNVRPAGPAGAHLHFEVAPGGGFAQPGNRDKTLRWLGYGQGGALQPGLSAIVNASGKPEAILTASQWDAVARQTEQIGRLVDALEDLIITQSASGHQVVVDGKSLREVLRSELRAAVTTHRTTQEVLP